MDNDTEPEAVHGGTSARRGPFGGLTVAEWLTALIGFGSALVGAGALWVAWLTYEAAQDTNDLKKAIGNLATLAEQTKRQADNTTGQLVILREQVGEAKKQTAAISGQTAAIKASADANVQSAQAQKRAADIGAAAAKASVKLTEVDFTELTGTPKDGRIIAKVKPTFTNVGGSSFIPNLVSFVMDVRDEPPSKPDYSKAFLYGGNEYVVLPGRTNFPVEPFEFDVPAEVARQMANGEKGVYVYGVAQITDAAGLKSSYCYAYRLRMKGGTAVSLTPFGGAAFHCGEQ